MYWLGVLLAAIGATLILSALAFVSALIGVLVNAMIVLMAGPIIDNVLAKRGGRIVKEVSPARELDFLLSVLFPTFPPPLPCRNAARPFVVVSEPESPDSVFRRATCHRPEPQCDR